MDVDAKEGAYGSLEEAIIAVGEFCKQTGIPLPNAWVCSGSGLHVYWIGKEALPPEQWLPYAEGLKAFAVEHGLKCDHNVTADPSRILRIPGTFNSKANQRRPVYLFALGSKDFDFATELSMLPGKKLAKKTRKRKAASTAGDDDASPSGDLPFAPVKAGCGWLRHVHDTGGKDQSEVLWRDALRCCFFLADGERLIHEFSSQYEGYDHDETKEKYAKAREYKEANDHGWPLCKTICDDGSAHCKTCPHRAAGKSPLHLAWRVPPDFKPPNTYEPVNREAPELAKLDAVWIGRIFEGDTNNSDLAFTVACELVRLALDDAFIARVLMNTRCGVHVQENPPYRLNRTIRRAYEFAIDPDLEKMNNQHAVLPIGGKTRVATCGDDPNPDFRGRKTIVWAQSFDDFKNLHSNKKKSIRTNEGTIKIGLGNWWLSREDRRQYDGGQRFMPQHEAEVVGKCGTCSKAGPSRPASRKDAALPAAVSCFSIMGSRSCAAATQSIGIIC
jgi:hypothetical protein